MNYLFRSNQAAIEAVYLELVSIRQHLETVLPKVRVRLKIGGQYPGSFTMKDTQSQVASIEIDDSLGFATGTKPDAAPTWAADDNGQFVTLTPAADGMSCVVAGKAPGMANLTVALAVGGKAFTGTAQVQVTAGDAAAVKVILAPPTP